MTEPYVTFDTLTIGAEYDPAILSAATAPAAAAPLLARLPRVSPERKPPAIQRLDEPQPETPASHLADTPAPSAPAPSRSEARQSTIRIDTGAAPTGGEPEPEFLPQPAIATKAEADADWSGWLLNFEATLQPYSRWIALAAVAAAMGLTAVLLRGGGPAQVAPAGAPQVDIGAGSHSLVAIEPSDWATPRPTDPTTPEVTRVAPTTLAGSPPPPSASGPASAYPYTARPELTTPIAPAAEVAEAQGGATQLR